MNSIVKHTYRRDDDHSLNPLDIDIAKKAFIDYCLKNITMDSTLSEVPNLELYNNVREKTAHKIALYLSCFRSSGNQSPRRRALQSLVAKSEKLRESIREFSELKHDMYVTVCNYMMDEESIEEMISSYSPEIVPTLIKSAVNRYIGWNIDENLFKIWLSEGEDMESKNLEHINISHGIFFNDC
jgi:hypothetical protein